jgi:hypothetical protein
MHDKTTLRSVSCGLGLMHPFVAGPLYQGAPGDSGAETKLCEDLNDALACIIEIHAQSLASTPASAYGEKLICIAAPLDCQILALRDGSILPDRLCVWVCLVLPTRVRLVLEFSPPTYMRTWLNIGLVHGALHAAHLIEVVHTTSGSRDERNC